MSDTDKMTYKEFRQVYESFDLKRKDIILITGKTQSALDKWVQEDIVKDPSITTLFRLAVNLTEEPHFYTKQEVVRLLYQSAGVTDFESRNPSFFENEDTSAKQFQMTQRLRSMMISLSEQTKD